MPKIVEKFEKRRANYSNGVFTHTREFLITLDNAGQGTPGAMSMLPQPNSSWQGLPLTRIDLEAVANSSIHFDALVEFATAELNTDLSIHPLARPPEVTWGFNDGSENYFIDTAGTAVVNSAGDKFSNDLTRERGDMVITCVQNEATHNPLTADKYSHSINTDAITIDGFTFPAFTLKLSPITAVKQTEEYNDGLRTQIVTYYKRNYVFKYRNPDRWGTDKPWRDHVLDRGMYESFSDTNPLTGEAIKSRRPIFDSNNLPVTEPIWPLDGSGNAASSKDAVPATLEFLPYVELPFAPLLIRKTKKMLGTLVPAGS